MTSVKVLLLKMDLTGREILTPNSVAGTSCLCSPGFLSSCLWHPLCCYPGNQNSLFSRYKFCLGKDPPPSDKGINVGYNSLCLLSQEYVQNLLINTEL